jgi:hypothetical protein
MRLVPCAMFSVCLLMKKKSTALLAAIKEYEANKWKVIGQKVGKPAKVCKTGVLCSQGSRADK